MTPLLSFPIFDTGLEFTLQEPPQHRIIDARLVVVEPRFRQGNLAGVTEARGRPDAVFRLAIGAGGVGGPDARAVARRQKFRADGELPPRVQTARFEFRSLLSAPHKKPLPEGRMEKARKPNNTNSASYPTRQQCQPSQLYTHLLLFPEIIDAPAVGLVDWRRYEPALPAVFLL
jgi:hypothetical protein